MSLSSAIFELESALRREKVCPEILMYEEELISRLVSRLDESQDKLNTAVESLDQLFETQIYQLDLDRVKYLISNYLRTRLLKIQTFAIKIAENSDYQMLSNKELDFVMKYYVLKTNHLKKSFLLKIPELLRGIIPKKDEEGKESQEHEMTPNVIEVNLEKHVFVKALEEIGGFRLGNGEEIMIQRDDIVLLPYSSVRELLKAKKVDLI